MSVRDEFKATLTGLGVTNGDAGKILLAAEALFHALMDEHANNSAEDLNDWRVRGAWRLSSGEPARGEMAHAPSAQNPRITRCGRFIDPSFMTPIVTVEQLRDVKALKPNYACPRCAR